MMFPSNYFLWPFCGILATLFSQTLLQPAQGNFDEIYTEMHEKLLHFQKLAQRIIENDDMDFHFFTEHELPRSEMTIRDYTSKNKNDEISKIMEKWRSEGIVDGAFFKRLAKICRRDYIEVDPETIKIMQTYPGLYDYVYLMAASKMLREHMVAAKHQVVDPAQQHHDADPHYDHPAPAVIPAKGKNYDRDEVIKIRALKSIVEPLYARLNREHYVWMRYVKEKARTHVNKNWSEQVPDDNYPTVEQRNQILKEVSLWKPSKSMTYSYEWSIVDAKPWAEAKSRYEHELDTLMQVKRVETEQIPEYLAELVFYEWATKKVVGTTTGAKNDAEKLMDEAEKASGEMKIEEDTASSTIENWKERAKGKGKMEE